MKHPTTKGGSVPASSVNNRRRVMIEVDADLFEEVKFLIATPDGMALFGSNTNIRQRIAAGAEAWMKNVTFGLRAGSGYRRAFGLEANGKGVQS